MKIEIGDWWMKPHGTGAVTLIGWTWFRNGSWASRYDDGKRLFYFYVGPIICGRVLFRLCVMFPTLFLERVHPSGNGPCPLGMGGHCAWPSCGCKGTR